MARNRDDDDERPARRGRDEERGSRSSRDDDDRPARGRDRDEERPSSRGRDRDDDDRPARRGGRDDDDEGSSGYRYEKRDAEATRSRADKGNNDYDRFLSSNVKPFKVNNDDNRIRILPPTWKAPKPDHYGLDIYVHYGVGADRQSYLCLKKMKGEDCPICEARDEVRKELADDEGNKDLEKLQKDMEPKRRVLIYLVDREHEREGLQAWAMPWTVDRDIVQVMQDKRSGEVLPIDDPEEGYDVDFSKKGAKDRTEYSGIAIARRSSPLGNDKWMTQAVKYPLVDQLVYFSYEHIAKVFGGKGAQRSGRDRDDDDRDRGGSGRDRDDDRRPSRDRDDDRPAARGRDREDDPPARGRSRDDEPTWESVHDMTKSELVDLIEEKDLDIKPKDAKDVEDLADWVCEEMKIKKAKPTARERVKDDDDGDDKLAAMRQRRERD